MGKHSLLASKLTNVYKLHGPEPRKCRKPCHTTKPLSQMSQCPNQITHSLPTNPCPNCRNVIQHHFCQAPFYAILHLTSSPRLKPGDSNSHLLAFLFHRVLPEWAFARPGLTASPQAATVSPTANTFFAALISRSWKV